MTPVSLSQQAYQTIRHKIVSLELPPGSVIDENQLRKELKLGRTPIREALKRLSLEKLVTIVPRRGMFITDIGITDSQRLFELRLVLEGMAAELAARRGRESHWRRMEAELAKIESVAESSNNETLIAIDEACHLIMYEATDNEFLIDVLNTLYALSLRLWHYSLPRIGGMQDTILEHKDILLALRAGDSQRARQLMERHIRAFQHEINASVLGPPG
jgi:DNA-binding GntR family transcriptional regulator